ncbi:structural constituent of nuclear pore protein [Ceratobasidium sp. AG-Ba]|nr:structural constituent of nuclear pore protein [Ceratobasidium sp. AG-Ba]
MRARGTIEPRQSHPTQPRADSSTVIVDWPYVLTTALAAIDPTTPLGTHLAFVGLLKTEFATTNWRIAEIHAVLSIKCCLFLIETSSGDSAFEITHGYSEGELKRLVVEAIRGNALQYLATILNMTRAHNEIPSDTLTLDEVTLREWNLVPRQEPSTKLMFYQYILQQVDILIVAFVTNLSLSSVACDMLMRIQA